ncbi:MULTISPECIES: LPS export ABC transporter periplasmic protein LptC [unclassified Sinorhizobium]|uniref:LPS export ABC transporter periplasmic protein LptC n=1 Tax=unclassified Sinorhizobium TaxID=2613772 RepID=UPI003526562C
MLNSLKTSTVTGYEASAGSAYRDAQFHSARVRRLKILLPLAAVVISMIFIGVSVVRAYLPENLKIEAAKIENGKVVMEKPAISGRNSQGISYSMKAERALQDIRDPNMITLENIKATMPVSGMIAQVEALSGDFDRSSDNLSMTAPFTINLSNGIRAHFQSAKLDTKAGSMTTEQPVSISQGSASILAQSLKMTDNGRVILFKGQVRMNVDPSTIQKQGS